MAGGRNLRENHMSRMTQWDTASTLNWEGEAVSLSVNQSWLRADN